MIKKILVALAIAVPSMAFAQKIAVVDAEAIMAALPDTKEAEEKLQQSSTQLQGEFDNLQQEMDRKYSEFQQLAADTPESIKERRQQEILELNQKIQRFQQQASQDLERQHNNLMQPIQEKVLAAIKSVGAEGQYSLVLPNGISLYTGADIVDITEIVKAKLGV